MSMMDKLKERISALRLEAETAQDKADDAFSRVKTLEQELLSKEQEVSSLTHKNTLLEEEVEKLEKQLGDAKVAAEEGSAHGTANEGLNRKLSQREEELEEADKNLRETTEKLRQTDVKAEQFERKVTSLESEVESWEKKYEDLSAKYAEAKSELEEINKQLEAF
ncbi:tropomyosin [Lipomyces japonicus]|uniref:tropomyosin n=1 Tax=Lipomyces japonicus TaxID=56871 RepID=UPI0034CE0D35